MRKTAIPTTRPPASVRRRLAAFGVDYLVIIGYSIVLGLITMALVAFGLDVGVAFAEPLRAQLISFALLTVPVVLYFAVCEGSAKRATPGKRALGIEVWSTSGGRLSWGRSLLRSALKFVPWELAHSSLWRISGWPTAVESIPAGPAVGLGVVWLLVAAYLLMPLTNPARQTPYDRVAEALVAHRSAGSANRS